MSNERIALYSYANGISDINVINQITEEKTNATHMHIDNVDNLLFFMSIIKSFDDIFSEFNDTLKKFETQLINLSSFQPLVQSQVSNILFQGYKYTENIKTFLSRQSSKKGREYFDSKIKDMYDNNFSYRLLYNLRNYDQHCGMPFHQIKKDRTTCKLLLNKNKFLDEHRQMQASFRNKIVDCAQNNYDIGVFLYEYDTLLGDLHEDMCKYYFSLKSTEYLASFNFIVQNFEPPTQESTYVLLEDYDVKKDSPDINFNIRNIDFHNSKKLLEIFSAI